MEISAVIDTAAEVTILSRTVFEKLKRKPSIVEEINLKGLNEDEPVKGQLINANLIIGSKTYKWGVYITETSDQCLLGLDFLYHHGVDIKLSTHSIKIAGEEIFASLVKTSGKHQSKLGYSGQTYSSSIKQYQVCQGDITTQSQWEGHSTASEQTHSCSNAACCSSNTEQGGSIDKPH